MSRKKKTVSGYYLGFLVTQGFAAIFWVVIIITSIISGLTFKDSKYFVAATATYTESTPYETYDSNNKPITRYQNYYTYTVDNVDYHDYKDNCSSPAGEGVTFTIYYDPLNPSITSVYASYKDATRPMLPVKIIAVILQSIAIVTFILDRKGKKEKLQIETNYRENVMHEARREFEKVDCGINEESVYNILEPQRLNIYTMQKKYEKERVAVSLPGPLVIITLIMVAISEHKRNILKNKIDSARNSFFIDYKRRITEPLLSNCFPTYRYLPSQGITRDELINSNVFQNYVVDKLETEDYVEGSYKNISYRQSDVIIQNTTSKSTSTVFSGRVGIYDYKKSGFDGELIIAAKQCSTIVNIGSFGKVEMENTSFNAAFNVYANSPHTAFYILTPHFMEHIMNLNAYGDLYIRFTNDKIYILRSNVSGMFEPDFDSPLDIQFEIGRSYHELKEIQDFIDTLNLEG